MYEESTNKGSFVKDLVIKLLYMLLFLFLFMWLYPAPKVDLSKVKVDVDSTALKPLLNGVFADNIESMRSAAKNYYTVERLPKNKGDKSSLSLQDMLNKKMVAPFVGEDGNTCDSKASYVEVTKNDTDYSLKVYLSCGDKKDYIVDTIGCTSTCVGCNTTPETIASKVVSAIKSNNVSTTSTSGSTNRTVATATKTVTSTQTKPSTTPATTNYEYVKDVTTWTTNNTWTTEVKSGNNVKLHDSRTTTKDKTTTKNYVYRTVAWLYGANQSDNYTLTLNNLPENTTNVEIINQGKFSGRYELNKYLDTRWYNDNDTYYNSYNNNYNNNYNYSYGNDCILLYNGSCPSRYNSNVMTDNEVLNAPVLPNYRVDYTYARRVSYGEWIVPIRITNYSYDQNDWTKYLSQYRFEVKYTMTDKTEVKEYQYDYSTTTTEYKYSTNPNDTSLINQGYRRK